MKFDDDGGVQGQPDCDRIPTCSMTGRSSGFRPLTQSLRAAQQQWPSATQQAISQKSGSLAESEIAGDKLLNSNTSAANAARHIAICLNAFAVIAPLAGCFVDVKGGCSLRFTRPQLSPKRGAASMIPS
ncbi:MAG: hypothetical protein ACREAB_14785 [Blastocatellia bacterium]